MRIGFDARFLTYPQPGGFKTYTQNLIAALKSSKTALSIGTLCLFLAADARAQRQMEKLGRGVIAVRTNSTSVYIGWRLPATDPNDIGFNLYRVSGGVTNLLNGAPITTSCNFVDGSANLNVANSYFVRPVLNAVEQSASASFTLPAAAPIQQYLTIPLIPPPGGTTADGVHIVPPGTEEEFLTTFTLAELPMVGPKFQEKLKRLGMPTVPEALQSDVETLQQWLGGRAGRPSITPVHT